MKKRDIFFQKLKNSLGEDSFNTWFKEAKIIRERDEEFVIELDSIETCEWVENNYLEILNEVASEITGKKVNVYLSTKNSNGQYTFLKKEMIIDDTQEEKFSLVYSRYTFDNFVVADFNRVAHSAAISVSKSPGKSLYNPLFIFGGNGVGKTHLILSIYNYIRKHKKGVKALYATTEKFKRDYTLSLRKNALDEFHKVYRNIDVLLLDDVQLLKGWESTQEELFHLYNSLFMRGKQIVLTADCPPAMLSGIQQRLMSRFHSGLIVEIGEPNIEAKIAILRKKAEENNIAIPFDVMEYIAMNTNTDIREIENCLRNLYINVCLNNKPLNINTAREILSYLQKTKKKRLTPELILEYVAFEFDVKKEEILSKKRNKEISLARYVAMYLMRKLLDIPLTKIGHITGNRNHATVIHGYNNIVEKLKNNYEFRDRVENLLYKIKNECVN